MKLKITLVVGVLVLVLAAGGLWLLAPEKPQVLPVPAQNGYDAILAAAAKLDPQSDHWDEIDAEELDRVVAANSEALAAIRVAAAGESVVPIDVAGDQRDVVQTGIDRIGQLARIGRAMLAVVRQAELADDSDAAATAAYDLLRLAPAASRGGLMIDHLKAAAYAQAALESLAKHAARLPAATARDLMEQLAAAPQPVEGAATVVDREMSLLLSRHNHLERVALTRVADAERDQSIQQLTAAQLRIAAQQAAVRIRLSLRLFQLENDRLPLKLVELVPEYLDELPVDPQSGADFVYQRQEGDYTLAAPPAATPE